MSTNSPWPEAVHTLPANPVIRIAAPGFPPVQHPAEPDLFCRQTAMPNHDQARLEAAHVAVVGAGGLGSWIGVGLARMGITKLTVIDADHFDRTNAPRQLMFGCDVGESKAHALTRNLAPHMTNPGVITGMAARVQEAVELMTDPPTAMVVGVDNNRARLFAARWCYLRQIPVVFVMLARDGQRAQVVCQLPGGPCLSCALPNMDTESAAPCSAAAVSSCMLAASHAIAALCGAIMRSADLLTWRESSLDGSTERVGQPHQRRNCDLCGSP